MKLKVNLTGTSRTVPEGEYNVVCTAVEEGVSQAGNDKLMVTYTIIDGEYEGRTVFDTFTLTDAAMWRIEDFLFATGQKLKGKIVLTEKNFLDKKVVITVEMQEYNGKSYARVSQYLHYNAPANKLASTKSTQPVIEEEDDDDWDNEPVPTKKSVPTKKTPKVEEDSEEDDDWDEPAPKKSAPKGKSKPAPKPVEDDDEDDWE